MMLYTKYQVSRPCGFRQEYVFMFSLYKPMYNMLPPGQAYFGPQGHKLNRLCRGLLDDATY